MLLVLKNGLAKPAATAWGERLGIENSKGLQYVVPGSRILEPVWAFVDFEASRKRFGVCNLSIAAGCLLYAGSPAEGKSLMTLLQALSIPFWNALGSLERAYSVNFI
eukprot:s436_g32.t1